MAADDPEDDDLEYEDDEYEDEYEDEEDFDADGDEEDLGDDLDPDDIDLDDIDFGDGDFDEKPAGSKKKKIILIGAGSFFGLILVALGAVIFLGDGGSEEEVAAESARPLGALAIPPKNRMKTGRELNRPNSSRQSSEPSGRAALRPPPGASATQSPRPQLSRAPGTPTAPRNGATPSQEVGPAARVNNTENSEPTRSRTPTSLASAAPPTTQVVGARIVPGAGLTVPSVTADAYRAIPLQPKSDALAAPNQDLMETVEGRVVPKVGEDGRKAWQTYAHPFKASAQKARVSLIIRGLGLSRNTTLAAINQLPPAVSLAFSPYTQGLEQWAGLARNAGHETLFSLPMEPVDFPSSDPGPLALMTDLQEEENIARLNQIMDLSQAFVGMVQNQGSRFATSEAAFQPVLQVIRDRGLMFVDDGQVNGGLGSDLANALLMPHARGDMVIDDNASGRQIAANLRELERIAREKQVAVGIGEALPATVLQISRWIRTLPGKNIELAPVSGVATVPTPPPPPENQNQ